MPLRARPWSLLTALVLLVPACNGDDDDDDGPSDPSGPNDPNDPMDPPSSWLVGEDGEMLRMNVEGAVSTYPLDHAGDLAAIACHGAATAWVVGAGGVVLRSRDAGASWTEVALGLPEVVHLRSVAVAEEQPEGVETLVIAGDDGMVLRSTDGGLRFDPLASPVVDFTAVATDALGQRVLVTGLDGSLWRSEGGTALVPMLAADGEALHDVAVSHDGITVVAVGEGGRVLRSDDGGVRFGPVPSGTTLDLHAVHLAADHETIVAVGEAGVVVRIGADGPGVQETLAAEDALYDVHLRADGLGQAVGTRGAVLLTSDAGLTWDRVETGRSADLRGVDDFHPAAHL